MDWLSDPQIWAGLLTLTALEIVLGIDNLVFIAVLVGRVKVERQALARKLGRQLPWDTTGVAWRHHLDRQVDRPGVGHRRTFSWRDLIMIGGGLFLLYKGTSGDPYAV